MAHALLAGGPANRVPIRRASAIAGLACGLLAGVSATRAADVTYERLANPEPQNWLMNHHDFSGQRFSALNAIDRSNIKNMKLLFAVALGGSSKDDSLEATPLVEDGFMYVVDSSGIVSKIDVRSGTSGPIMWRMDPKQERPDRNRGVALWNNLVFSVTGYAGRVVATDKETGKVVWDRNLLDQDEVGFTELTAAPLALKDTILVASSGGDHGVRSWLASLDPKTGNVLWKTYSVPAPGEPGSETWKDKNNAWQTGGGAFYGTGTYDPAANLTYWGSGNPVPAYDSSYRPGDNLYTNSALALDAASGKIRWYHQYTPNDNRDYDETGSHIIIDTKVDGEDRKILVHPARNGFEYAFDRISGQFLKAVQTVRQVTWTKGIDPKTGKPLDYDPARDIQLYAAPAAAVADKGTRQICPYAAGGTNFWPSSYSRRTGLLYLPTHEGCGRVTTDTSAHVRGRITGGAGGEAGPITGGLLAIDAGSGEVKRRVDMPYPNSAGVLATAGGIVVTAMIDGTILAYDDQTLEELWRINVGSGFNAPPIAYAVNGKQYIAIASGLCCDGRGGPLPRNSRGRVARTPELRLQGNANAVWVFGL
jgi:alcohol dehydrogenase (cytochrome c)